MTDKYSKFFRASTKDLHKRLIGECKQCGKCCREAWRFNYMVSLGNNIESDYKKENINNHICKSFDQKTNKCKIHYGNKPAVCEYWPLLESDLEQIDCPGFTFIKEEE